MKIWLRRKAAGNTKRKQILIDIAKSKSTKEIASDMNLTDKTIYYHRRILCEELGIISKSPSCRNVLLTRYAVANKLITV